jgi:D-threonine aldolase
VLTPALVVDVAAADRNIARVAHLPVRPHLKAHKCTTLLRRQLTGHGVTCATAFEALVLARAGFDDVLLANEVASPAARALLAEAAALTRLTVCADDRAHVELLRGLPVEALVEVDVGQGRCGVAPGDAVALAREVVEAGLRLRGLQGYEGHAQLDPSREARAAAVARTTAVLTGERDALRAAGLPCELLTGGGTGTLDLHTALDDLQAGSYVLGDATYGALRLGFEQALHLRTTVLHRRGDHVVLDAGWKAASAEYGLPRAPGLTVTGLSDEHATARLDGTRELQVGDLVDLVPAHVDPTVALHPVLHTTTGAAWPVDARR